MQFRLPKLLPVHYTSSVGAQVNSTQAALGERRNSLLQKAASGWTLRNMPWLFVPLSYSLLSQHVQDLKFLRAVLDLLQCTQCASNGNVAVGKQSSAGDVKALLAFVARLMRS